MQVSQKSTILGRYAIYFRSLTDALMEHRRVFFGNERAKPIEMIETKHDPSPSEAANQQHEEVDKGIGKLQVVVEKAQNILIKATAVFPFDLFPDSITIDRQKLTVVHHSFFSVKQTVSVQHSDIKNIQADIGPFFGSLTVTSEHFINNIQTIKFLPKKDALSIQQLVQGFIIAYSEGVDMSEIDDEKLVELLNRLGRGEAGERVVPPRQ